MPLTPADDDVLAKSYRSLQEKPITPDDPYYVEIWEHSDYDPVRRLCKHIVWPEIESLQLFSGFSGSGKSTKLFRLREELTQRGYFVVYANAVDYLNLGEPIEMEELLVVIAGAFSDNLDKSLVVESYWKRLLNYLDKTKVNVSEVTFKLDPVSFKAELKASPTFRQRVRKVIQTNLPEVRRQVKAFVEDVVKAVEAKDASRRGVFLFDSFEKFQGTPSN